jgi:putative membrane protein
MLQKYFPHFLLLIYILESIICWFHPYSRDVWYAENTPIIAIVFIITVLYIRGVQFSNTAYAMMFVLPFLHTIGGHYSFERVPFDWFNNTFGFERNMFDRVAHFSVGLYGFAFAEISLNKKLITKKWFAVLCSIFMIAFVAMSYEIIEWIYAVKEGGSAGIAFLGSQGDIWDAQKDMAMDTIGAIFAGLFYYFTKSK